MIDILNKTEWTHFLHSGRTKKLVCVSCNKKIVKAKSEFKYDYNQQWYSFKPRNLEQVESGNYHCYHCDSLLGRKVSTALQIYRKTVKLVLYHHNEKIMIVE